MDDVTSGALRYHRPTLVDLGTVADLTRGGTDLDSSLDGVTGYGTTAPPTS